VVGVSGLTRSGGCRASSCCLDFLCTRHPLAVAPNAALSHGARHAELCTARWGKQQGKNDGPPVLGALTGCGMRHFLVLSWQRRPLTCCRRPKRVSSYAATVHEGPIGWLEHVVSSVRRRWWVRCSWAAPPCRGYPNVCYYLGIVWISLLGRRYHTRPNRSLTTCPVPGRSTPEARSNRRCWHFSAVFAL
jgi:hypothetical protein